MKVVATRTGQFNLRRYKTGQEFVLTSPEQFSAAWMEPVGTVPKEFAVVVEQRVEAFANRKTPEQIRREADEAGRKSRDLAMARAIGEGLRDVLREQHVQARAAAGSPAAPAAAPTAPGAPASTGAAGGDQKGTAEESVEDSAKSKPGKK